MIKTDADDKIIDKFISDFMTTYKTTRVFGVKPETVAKKVDIDVVKKGKYKIIKIRLDVDYIQAYIEIVRKSTEGAFKKFAKEKFNVDVNAEALIFTGL